MANGGILMSLIGRPFELIFTRTLRSETAFDQAVVFSRVPAAVVTAVAMEDMGLKIRFGLPAALLAAGLSPALSAQRTIAKRMATDKAKLHSCKVALRAIVRDALHLAEVLAPTSHLLEQAAHDLANAAENALISLNQLH